MHSPPLPVAWAAAHSKLVVVLLLVRWLLLLPLFVRVLCLFCSVVYSVRSIFELFLMVKRELFA